MATGPSTIVALLIFTWSAAAICKHATDNSAHFLPSEKILGFNEQEWHHLFELLDRAHRAKPLGNTYDYKHATPLANLYFRLHRQLFAVGDLPVGTWGREFEGQAGLQPKDHTAHKHWDPVPELSRASINRFWHLNHYKIPHNSRCLEYDPVFYATHTDRCTEKWVLYYEKDQSKWHVDNNRHTIHIDLAHHESAKLLPKDYFDAIISTQAIQYPTGLHHVIRAWHAMLKADGLLLLSAPYLERVDGGFQDRYRFTLLGVKTLMERSGFTPQATYVGGNSMLTTAFLMGFGATDISTHEREGLLIDVTGQNSPHELYYGVYGTWVKGHHEVKKW